MQEGPDDDVGLDVQQDDVLAALDAAVGDLRPDVLELLRQVVANVFALVVYLPGVKDRGAIGPHGGYAGFSAAR